MTPDSTSAPAAAGPGTDGPAVSTPAPATWTVRPGDHLWSIAAATLTAAHPDDPPDEEAVAAYWWQVVTVNRPHLPNPADIDLLYPGDVVTLPPLPG
jgi:nucleoid-associated protein YgaU